MTPLQILQLVGFATGALLHLYIAWLILLRRKLIEAEKALVLLGGAIGVYFLGSLLTMLYRLLNIKDLTPLLYVADTIAFAGVGLLPTALLHVHFAFWGMWDDSPKRRYYWVGVIFSYLPLVVVPAALYQLYIGPYQPPLVKLADWIVPHTVWLALALWISAGIDARLSTQVRHQRERRFYQVLSLTLTLIGVTFILVYIANARDWRVIGPYLETGAMLSSLLPTAIGAYYIYRYGFLELIIKQSFVYAGFAAVIVVVYVYGVRTIDDFLVQRYQLTPHVIETILTLALVFVAQPLKHWMDLNIKQLFAREINLYRNLVRQVTREAAAFGDLETLSEFLQNTVRRGLGIERVRILTYQQATHAPAFEVLLQVLDENRLPTIEDEQLLQGLQANLVYPLWRENRLVGLMLLDTGAQTLDSERRAMLAVLSNQLAITLENCHLTEEKVQLERELAQRERLAVLGQMAATVAHEVKNPLSAIKSIVQVMREDETLQREYERDLSLILGEIDRLNRTVTQMLSFSRPYRLAGEDMALGQMINNSMRLMAAEAQAAGVELKAEVTAEAVLSGGRSAALSEILNNLLLNAIQATPAGGSVAVTVEEEPRNNHRELAICVIDTGPGIPSELRARVFEPFFTTKQRGTGLGLAIVQRRIAELGGSFELKSPVTDGHGTCFRLILPLDSADSAA